MEQKQFTEKYSLKNKSLAKRYETTIEFLKEVLPPPANILDLGIENPFVEILAAEGFSVTNTDLNQDLDLDYHQVEENQFDAITAFEIFEHLVAPFNLLREIKAEVLIASVPIDLWFAKAYWNENDPWDRHFHEFEPRQFDMLLDKAGWKVIKSKKWASYSNKIGIRPILRRITPRYYLVYCKRKKDWTKKS